jgi:hypothetical protein
MSPIDNYFLEKKEPVKSCLLFLRSYILQYDANITEVWRYGMPFYLYKEKRVCYLWVNKKSDRPYIGLVNGYKINHALLLQEKRTRMKIMLFDPSEDIPVKAVAAILKMAIALCKE